MTVLPGNPELRDVMFDAGSDCERPAFSALAADDVWRGLTSAGPDTASDLAKAARQRGVSYGEGGPDDARRGRLALTSGAIWSM